MNKNIIFTAALMLSSAVCVASANAPVSKKLADGSITVANSVASTQREVSNEGMTITVSYSIPETMVTPTLHGHARRMACADSNNVVVENLTPGVYIVALAIDGAVVDTKKIVIK